MMATNEQKDKLLERFLEWIEENLDPAGVYFDDAPLHAWAISHDYVLAADVRETGPGRDC